MRSRAAKVCIALALNMLFVLKIFPVEFAHLPQRLQEFAVKHRARELRDATCAVQQLEESMKRMASLMEIGDQYDECEMIKILHEKNEGQSEEVRALQEALSEHKNAVLILRKKMIGLFGNIMRDELARGHVIFEEESSRQEIESLVNLTMSLTYSRLDNELLLLRDQKSPSGDRFLLLSSSSSSNLKESDEIEMERE